MEPRLPDLTDFMNDWFFGIVDADGRKDYDLSGGEIRNEKEEEGTGGRRQTLSASRLTQEWLEEANKMVAANSTSRHASPVHSPRPLRFAVASPQTKVLPPPPELDGKEDRRRSARRNRSIEAVSDEILQRSSARHTRSLSVNLLAADSDDSPRVPTRPVSPFEDPDGDPSSTRSGQAKLPPALKSRFLDEALGVRPRRTFCSRPSSLQPSLIPNTHHLHLPQLPTPRNLVSSTCYFNKASAHLQRRSVHECTWTGVEEMEKQQEDVKKINSFLRRQKSLISRVSDSEASVKCNIVLSSYTPNTSSIVSAVCYAWLLENKREKEKKGTEEEIVLPVINIRRAGMLEHKEAAWLFYHLGIDASALMFSDELDLEGLLMCRELNLLVVGQDVLQTNEEVGSLCTVLTDNYCEHAYNLLQTSNLKKLLLAGILLDTQNLSAAKPFTNRDVEAVQLLLVGSSPNYQDFFFEQLMQDRRDNSFIEVLRQHYGKLPGEADQKPSTTTLAVKQSDPAAVPVKGYEKSSPAKKKFSLGRLFGFGSK